jgi:hypothetical protein
MRSIFAGLAVTVALSLGACGAKPAGSDGKECKIFFEKFDTTCKDAKDAAKAFCDGKKGDVETLKKTPSEETCKALAGALNGMAGNAVLAPTGTPPAGTPATPEAGSAPAGEPAGEPGSAPAGDGK